MSTALGIAAVTAVMKDLLQNGVIDGTITEAVGEVLVTAQPPDRIKVDATERSQLNLFMYHVAPNAAWRNVELPSRDSRGRSVANPPLALDLHYMLTAYSQADFHAEILLGYAMQLLHETPLLTKPMIRRSLQPSHDVTTASDTLPPAMGALAASDLAEQVEQIRITPQLMNTEEMSKVWTAMQAHYRPTAAYHVSVLLIEGRLRSRVAPPVTGATVKVVSFRRPVLDSVKPLRAPAGATLSLDGLNLRGDSTRVLFRGGQAAPSLLGENHLEVVLPATLPAGMQSVRVVHGVDLGTPSDPHPGPESNEAPFVLTPQVTVPAGPAPQFTVARGGTLNLTITPPVWRTQRVRLLVGDQTLTLLDRQPTSPPASDASLPFVIPSTWPAGDFLLRVQVDGAESPLTVDPATRQFVGPQVRIT
jgi:hypothetical protein